MPRQFGRRDVAVSEFVAAIEHVGVGHLLVADAHLKGGAIFRHQRPQLLEQVGAEESRLGDRGGIDAGRLEFAPGAAGHRDRTVRLPHQAKFGITEAPALLRVRRRAARSKARQRITLRLHGIGMHRLQPVYGLVR